jgi:serine/arginine repetitive matrix protein 2
VGDHVRSPRGDRLFFPPFFLRRRNGGETAEKSDSRSLCQWFDLSIFNQWSMYNGIGLSTARGSATSGHVQKNASYVRPEFFRKKIDQNTGREQSRNGWASDQRSIPNKDLLEHNRKHAIEAKVYELDYSLREQGLEDDVIEQRTAALREKLTSSAHAVVSKNKTASTDTHEISMRKADELEKLRNAFGIEDSFVSGAAFDPEAQEKRKIARQVQRQKDYEERENARVARQQERDNSRERREKEREGRERGERDTTGRGKEMRGDSRDRRRIDRDDSRSRRRRRVDDGDHSRERERSRDKRSPGRGRERDRGRERSDLQLNDEAARETSSKVSRRELEHSSVSRKRDRSESGEIRSRPLKKVSPTREQPHREDRPVEGTLNRCSPEVRREAAPSLDSCKRTRRVNRHSTSRSRSRSSSSSSSSSDSDSSGSGSSCSSSSSNSTKSSRHRSSQRSKH